MMFIIKGPFATIDHVNNYINLELKLVAGAEIQIQTSATQL